MSLSSETQRVQQGVKDTLKTLIQKLGGTVASERVDGYPALANAISNKLLPDNLLSADTAALYGKPGTATPNEIFAQMYNAGSIEKVFESSTAGATTFDLPADTLVWWGLAVGGGGGGSYGGKESSSNDGYGGTGGNGGQVLLYGPMLPSAATNNSIVVGAGGAGGVSSSDTTPAENGGSTSIFGLIVADGGLAVSNREDGVSVTRFLKTYAVGGAGPSGGSAGNAGEDGVLVSIGPYLMKVAAGGGSGAGTVDSGTSPGKTGGAGGNATLGAGGKGGDSGNRVTPGNAGLPGSPGGGGGGGGSGSYYTVDSHGLPGGKGGDGYAAIFIIRKGGRT